MEKEVIKPTMNLIEKERIEYNYILYIGVIIDKNNNAFVLEYNSRLELIKEKMYKELKQ